jgi:hypothetical protein
MFLKFGMTHVYCVLIEIQVTYSKNKQLINKHLKFESPISNHQSLLKNNSFFAIR